MADAVAELVDELPRLGRITFARLTGALAERLEVIVRFLALLELYKRGWVDLEQASNFAELDIRWVGTEGGGDDAVADFPGRGVIRASWRAKSSAAIEAIVMVAEEPVAPRSAGPAARGRPAGSKSCAPAG